MRIGSAFITWPEQSTSSFFFLFNARKKWRIGYGRDGDRYLRQSDRFKCLHAAQFHDERTDIRWMCIAIGAASENKEDDDIDTYETHTTRLIASSSVDKKGKE